MEILKKEDAASVSEKLRISMRAYEVILLYALTLSTNFV